MIEMEKYYESLTDRGKEAVDATRVAMDNDLISAKTRDDARAKLVSSIKKAMQEGISATYLAQHIGISRAWVYELKKRAKS